MVHIAKMVDMKRTPPEKKAEAVSVAGTDDGPMYPYGLCLSLGEEEMAKLGLDADCTVGETVHLFALAKVTSCSSNETENGGKRCRIELQITDMAAESEDDENEEMDLPEAVNAKKMQRRYGTADAGV